MTKPQTLFALVASCCFAACADAAASRDTGAAPDSDAIAEVTDPETSTPDTSVPDDEVLDTSIAPETVADSGPADTQVVDVADSEVADSEVADSAEVTDSVPADSAPSEVEVITPTGDPLQLGLGTALWDNAMPRFLELLDLDGDRRMDFVINASNLIGSGLARGDGTFAVTHTGGNTLSPYDDFAHGDVDGDGHDDLIVCSTSEVRVLRGRSGNASGLVDPNNAQLTFDLDEAIFYCAAADFDHDGATDVVARVDDGLVIAWSTRTGFEEGARTAGDIGPIVDIVANDFGGDGSIEVVTVGLEAIQLMRYDDRGLVAGDHIDFGENIQRVAATEDGIAVVVAPDGLFPRGTLYFVAVAPDGSLGEPLALPISDASYVVAGDLDGDARDELVVSRGMHVRHAIWKRSGGQWSETASYELGNHAEDIDLGDVDGDGDLDLVATRLTPSTIDVLLGTGQGTFGAQGFYATDANLQDAVIGDLVGDDCADVVLVDGSVSNSYSLSVMRCVRGAGYERVATMALDRRPDDLLIADISGDAAGELLMLKNGRLDIYRFGAGGTLESAGGFDVDASSARIWLVDFNGDGRRDLVLNGSGAARVYIARADRSFDPAQPIEWPTGIVDARDVDGDGIIDLLRVATWDGASWLRGTAAWTFGAETFIDEGQVRGLFLLDGGPGTRRWVVVGRDGTRLVDESGSGTTAIDLGGADGSLVTEGDWNHDGRTDLVVSGSVVTVLLGQPDGTFVRDERTLLGGGTPLTQAFTDVTGDGRPDLVRVNYTSGITVLVAP